MALEGARHILIEQFTQDALLTKELRKTLWDEGILTSKVVNKDKASQTESSNFKDYFDYQEAIAKIPSHRALALFRGQEQSVLRIKLILTENQEQYCKQQIAQTFNVSNKGRKADDWLIETVATTWQVKYLKRIQSDCLTHLRSQAELTAIDVFASNLNDLLLAAPAGSQVRRSAKIT